MEEGKSYSNHPSRVEAEVQTVCNVCRLIPDWIAVPRVRALVQSVIEGAGQAVKS
jgi:hypothetical protein